MCIRDRWYQRRVHGAMKEEKERLQRKKKKPVDYGYLGRLYQQGVERELRKAKPRPEVSAKEAAELTFLPKTNNYIRQAERDTSDDPIILRKDEEPRHSLGVPRLQEYLSKMGEKLSHSPIPTQKNTLSPDDQQQLHQSPTISYKYSIESTPLKNGRVSGKSLGRLTQTEVSARRTLPVHTLVYYGGRHSAESPEKRRIRELSEQKSKNERKKALFYRMFKHEKANSSSAEVKTLFDRLDLNKDGEISGRDFERLPKEEARRYIAVSNFLRKFDISVDYEEFLLLLDNKDQIGLSPRERLRNHRAS
eukprot:TRINITY_DN3631_c0_g1_i3.p1 TRINITY_DN3631_c0_g1~~TRINITY_DN3631_c0_g1_i3.p1  ORF type:complete len:306 (+),score=55.46 TRINITY_DN3631_c0_g1_i3:78-995(+)